NTKFVVKYLASSLLKLYVSFDDYTRSQFFDSYNIKSSVTNIIRFLWKKKRHRNSMVEFWKNDEESVPFFRILISDTFYLFEEYLTVLTKVNTRNIPINVIFSSEREHLDEQRRIYFELSK